MQASLKLLETMYTKNFKLLKNSAELVVSFLNFYFRSSLLKQKKKKKGDSITSTCIATSRVI